MKRKQIQSKARPRLSVREVLMFRLFPIVSKSFANGIVHEYQVSLPGRKRAEPILTYFTRHMFVGGFLLATSVDQV